MSEFLLGLSAEYPDLGSLGELLLSSGIWNAAEILLTEGNFSDLFPLIRLMKNLAAADKKIVLTLKTRKKKSGFFRSPARQEAFLSDISGLLREISGFPGIAGVEFDFPEEEPPEGEPLFFSRVSELFSDFVSPDLSFFVRRDCKKQLGSSFEEELFYLDFVRKLNFRRFFLRDFFDLQTAFFSGAGGVFFSLENAVRFSKSPFFGNPAFRKALRLFGLTRRESDTAVLFHPAFRDQAESFLPGGYVRTVFSFCRCLIDSGLRPDLLLLPGYEEYSLIFSPFCAGLSDEAVTSVLLPFVERGGVWICGPLPNTQGKKSVSARDAIRRASGAFVKEKLDFQNTVSAIWKDGQVFEGRAFFEEYYRGPDDLVYRQGGAFIKCRKIGKGRLILLGALPSESDLKKLIGIGKSFAGLPEGPIADSGVLSAPFSGFYEDGKLLRFTAVYSPERDGEIVLLNGSVDLLSGEAGFGSRRLEKNRLYCLKQFD